MPPVGRKPLSELFAKMIEKRAGCEYAEGTITGLTPPLEFAVHLDDGRNVSAILPRSLLRKMGCLFGTLEGWRVSIAFRSHPKLPVILELRRPHDQREHTR